MLMFNVSPTSTRAYYPYAQTQQVTPLPKAPAKGEPVFETIDKVAGYATGYFGPRPEDYATRKEYLEAIRMNGDGKKTASLEAPYVGSVAVDPKYYKVGTVFVFSVDKKIYLLTATDTGSSVKGKKHIDIFFGFGKEAGKDAREWGRTPITFEVRRIKKVIGA